MGFNVMWVKILGVVLLLVGLWGFFSSGMVLGFAVNTTHNIVHLVSGVILLWAGFGNKGASAPLWNKIFGLVYLVVAVLGLLSVGFVVDLLALNSADNWLHLVIGVVTIGVGFWG
jgi:hypothetical protein